MHVIVLTLAGKNADKSMENVGYHANYGKYGKP
jgi:hypothetical protein